MRRRFKLRSVEHIVIRVEDVAASACWYERTFGLEREDYLCEAGEELHAALSLGARKISLRPGSATENQRLCFATEMQPQTVIKHLQRLDIPIVAGPVGRNGPNGLRFSVYCYDPDGNLIEVASKRRGTEIPSTADSMVIE